MSTEVAQTAAAAKATNDPPTAEDQLNELYEKIDELANLTKWFQRQGKAVVRKHTKKIGKKAAAGKKDTRREGGSAASEQRGFCAPVRLSTALSTLLKLDPAAEVPRTEVTRMLTAYIKSNRLQCENKKHFVCDDGLATVFSVEPGTQTNWFEMQRFLSKVLTTVKKTAAGAASEDAQAQQPTSSASPVVPAA